MLSFTKTAISATLLLSLTACATFTTNENDKAPYFEASFDDKNRAPASLTPPVISSQDGQATLDPLYMRTQADYYFSMGEAYSLEGNAAKAIESFKMTLIYDQNSPTVNMRLAGEYLKQGMISESLTQAEEAVKKDGKNVDAHLLLGGLYSSMKLYPKAMDQYHTVLKLDPKNTEAPLYIGALYSEQKQSDKAVSYFESLVKNPDYTSPYLAQYYIGRVRMEQPEAKFQKAAEAAFKKALVLKPDFADAVLSLGALYSKQKNEAKAITLYRNFQKENSPSPKIAEVLSQTFIEQGKYDLAYEQLEVLEQNTDEPLNVKMKMALILIEQKKYPLATEKLEAVLKEAPESDKVRFYLAAVYEETHQNEKAVREFKKIPASSTFFGEATVHSAYLLKGMNRLDEAVEVISKGLAERSDQPQVYAMYASLLDEKNDYKAAAKVLEQGLEKFPENAQLRFYYGTINDRLGKKDVVITEMKKVLELDPNHVQGLNYLAFTWAELNQNLPDAEKLARRAMELEPQDGYVLDTLGWILYKQSKFTEAVKFLEAAHKFQGTVSVIAEHLGDAYYKQSMVDKAKKMYRKAADLESDKNKVKEIRNKITAIEKQELSTPRLPASVEAPLAEHTSK
ncbi:tetratricopeptide repeat protein [Bdellovibrio svalbardensis]|uniref:Tetratricopeptide repeat protein n=1 Tax=Bdellovibrio svalbardensis TaxID=2972972 RepID=A0ABT6DFV7_9BACT|nr:tetratricopeptide repeat protein [Bdellovibrio svalbardensis]MDG0814741.1 tetratricopeptide repeat protein [Bdellovibrio svalbardensis]